MKLILDGTDNKRFDPTLDLRVCLAYQNAGFALRAKAMLERVGQAAGESGRLVCSLWNFKDLTEPKVLREAAVNATRADLMVIAAPEGESLPQQVRDWIARWLLTKKDLPRALVANVQREPEQTQAQQVVLPYLARVAEYGHMQFFGGSLAGEPPVNLALVRPPVAPKLAKPGPLTIPQPLSPAATLTGMLSIYATMTPRAPRRAAA